jgi:mannosyl-3-phosphoglycerate phosphatase
MTRWWVVSDLDGTLLDERYDWRVAAPCLAALRRRGVPVIPCTSKTAAEVRDFRRAASLDGPYIVENGGAVHGGAAGREWQLVLGRPSAELTLELDALAQELGVELRALSACTPEEMEALTGLRGEAARRAQQRQWSLPFLPPAPAHWRALQAAARRRGLQVVQGNRLAHLLAAGCDKGRALTVLRRRCAPPGLRVLALGDSPNDLPLLEAGDVAVVVPGPAGPHPQLQEGIRAGRWQLAPAPHGAGWAAAVAAVLELG